ncbi:hypothetical protein PoB_006964300 [Plakobranchus ocellatus]|uniref:Uncharacterized protein n=1 Tax=Plakobranchus ocellatus TaxID=259542 RepID=A0AAV4DFY5_9GAST|nr:hypothetical protein PoB_006964300 [Plakobranchus ocellatus]
MSGGHGSERPDRVMVFVGPSSHGIENIQQDLHPKLEGRKTKRSRSKSLLQRQANPLRARGEILISTSAVQPIRTINLPCTSSDQKKKRSTSGSNNPNSGGVAASTTKKR